MTIARVRPGDDRLHPPDAPPPEVPLAIDHLALVRSKLGGGHAAYHEILRRTLA